MSMNPLPPSVWEARHRFKALTRDFFDQEGFIEVDTPTLVQYPSCEPHLDPYPVELESESDASSDASAKGYLCTSPEFGLKKILGSGCERIYEMAHSFRAHEQGNWHSREFIMLEWYVKGFELKDLEKQCAQFLSHLFPDLPQHHFTVSEWMQQQLGLPDLSEESLKNELKKHGRSDLEDMSADEAFFRLFLPTESALEDLGIVFLSHYPSSQRSYATTKDGFAQRFEVYIRGVEVGNAFEEEKSSRTLKQLLETEIAERNELGKAPLGIDQDFVHALAHIQEPISGIAMGWDRLFALWNGHAHLRESSPFLAMTKHKTSDNLA